jgi:type IV pilus assembly protein PilN
MIRINLLPREEKPSREALTWIRVFTWGLIASALIVVVGIGVFAFRTYEIRVLKSDIAEQRLELAKYEGQAALVRDLMARRQAIQRRIEIIEALDHDRFLRVQVLDELARSVPEYVWLDLAEEKAGTMTVKGMAFSNLAISQFMDALDAKSHVDSVFLKVIRKDEVDEQPVLGFEIGYKIPISQLSKPQVPAAQAGQSKGEKPGRGAKTS